MPETLDQTLALLRSVVASSVKAGNTATDPVGITAGHAMLVRRKGRGDGVVEVVATTDDIDIADEVVVPGGANLDYFRRNGSVFIDHDTRMESRVGVAQVVRSWPSAGTQRGWMVDIAMDSTDAARDLLAKCENGGMGVSIGFRARDYGAPTMEEAKRYAREGKTPRSIVRAWDWLELSFTPMPCNVACRVVGLPSPAKAAVDAPRRKEIVVIGNVAFTRYLPAMAS